MENGPIENKIINSLNHSMNISSLKVLNESYMHNVPKDSESHFKMVIVSNDFKNLFSHQLYHQVWRDVENRA